LSTRPSDLPDFDRPPIDEVAIAVQFAAPLLGFTEAHAGLYWQSIKDDYPQVTVHPRIVPVIETLEEGAAPRQQIVFPTVPTVGGLTWLISANDEYVLRIQSDRLCATGDTARTITLALRLFLMASGGFSGAFA
jgi:uncharacterized protein (TIGR04255 family)